MEKSLARRHLPQRPAEVGVPVRPLTPEGSERRRSGFLPALREFLFGMMGYEFTQHALEMRASLETLFMVITIGDIIGVPVIPPYYALRLLPYTTPQVATWKRRVLREREMTDEHEYDLHGI
jgi:hypothetical protein